MDNNDKVIYVIDKGGKDLIFYIKTSKVRREGQKSLLAETSML